MADLYEVLYCFGCKEHTLVVKRRARKATMTKCKACGAKNTVGLIQNAMRLRKIQAKRYPTSTAQN